MSTSVSPTAITDRELEQIECANATTATPLVFIHGLWLLPSSWASWSEVAQTALNFVKRFASPGYRPGRSGGIAPGRP